MKNTIWSEDGLHIITQLIDRYISYFTDLITYWILLVWFDYYYKTTENKHVSLKKNEWQWIGINKRLLEFLTLESHYLWRLARPVVRILVRCIEALVLMRKLWCWFLFKKKERRHRRDTIRLWLSKAFWSLTHF